MSLKFLPIESVSHEIEKVIVFSSADKVCAGMKLGGRKLLSRHEQGTTTELRETVCPPDAAIVEFLGESTAIFVQAEDPTELRHQKIESGMGTSAPSKVLYSAPSKIVSVCTNGSHFCLLETEGREFHGLFVEDEEVHHLSAPVSLPKQCSNFVSYDMSQSACGETQVAAVSADAGVITLVSLKMSSVSLVQTCVITCRDHTIDGTSVMSLCVNWVDRVAVVTLTSGKYVLFRLNERKSFIGIMPKKFSDDKLLVKSACIGRGNALLIAAASTRNTKFVEIVQWDVTADASQAVISIGTLEQKLDAAAASVTIKGASEANSIYVTISSELYVTKSWLPHHSTEIGAGKAVTMGSVVTSIDGDSILADLLAESEHKPSKSQTTTQAIKDVVKFLQNSTDSVFSKVIRDELFMSNGQHSVLGAVIGNATLTDSKVAQSVLKYVKNAEICPDTLVYLLDTLSAKCATADISKSAAFLLALVHQYKTIGTGQSSFVRVSRRFFQSSAPTAVHICYTALLQSLRLGRLHSTEVLIGLLDSLFVGHVDAITSTESGLLIAQRLPDLLESIGSWASIDVGKKIGEVTAHCGPQSTAIKNAMILPNSANKIEVARSATIQHETMKL